MKNPIDAVVSFFSAEGGMRRARARNAQRIYEGASIGRRATSWKAYHTSANAEFQTAIRPLRDRSRDLVRNTPHGQRALDIITAHAVGTGITPVSSTGMAKIDKKVTELWKAWQVKADVTGLQTFNAMQALAVRSMVESGEAVARFIDVPLDNTIPVPFQIQLLEADYIDQFRDGIYGTALADQPTTKSLEKSRLGVGLGKYDKRIGLWLWPYHPGEITTINLRPLISEFVSDDELVHMFKVQRPGQVRGVPWFAPILMTSRDLSDIIDAANVKARTEACFAGFITNDDSLSPLLDSNSSGVDPGFANPDASITTLEPGMLKELRTGQDIKFAQPTSTSQLETILMYNLQGMAVGVGLTYDQLTGDLRQANYSSLRAGKLDFWRLIDELQEHTIIPMFCQPVWDRFISRAILSGQLPDRSHIGGYPCEWVVPAKEMIDPKKDFDAMKNMVRAGGMTPQQFIASLGGDSRITIEQFKVFFDAAHAADQTFDIDVGRVDQHGRQPSKPGETTDGAKNDAEDAANDATDDAADDAEAA